MAFIAEGGGRTVHNCTVYDARKLYEYTASVVLDVCQSNMGGEVEKTGATVVETRVYHVIATSEDLARALIKEKWGSKSQRHTLIGIKVLFTIDSEISYGHK